MCAFAALWASKGVAGFMRTREGASKGGGGFIWVRKSSPCGAVSSRKREKVRPACSKHPKFGVFVLAGRVFSRKSRWRGRAGRVFSRQPVLRLSVVGVAVHFRVTAMGVLRHAKPSVGASPPCRRLGWRHSPPSGGGGAVPRGGVAAKVQTHWTKVAENGLFWLNGTALWRICCLSWCVVRTRTRYCDPKPAISHVNPLLRAWAGLPRLVLAG